MRLNKSNYQSQRTADGRQSDLHVVEVFDNDGCTHRHAFCHYLDFHRANAVFNRHRYDGHIVITNRFAFFWDESLFFERILIFASVKKVFKLVRALGRIDLIGNFRLLPYAIGVLTLKRHYSTFYCHHT